MQRLVKQMWRLRPIPEKDRSLRVADIAREDVNTMAQVASNPRDVAMNGNIQGTVQAAVVQPMLSHQAQAEHLLKQDHQALAPFTALIYEMLKSGKNIDLSGVSG